MADTLFETMTQEMAFDGHPAKLVKLKNKNGMSVTFMDIGATWLSCEIPVGSEVRDVLLGVKTMRDHQRQSVYLGATVGRFANRISNGQFTIAGQYYQVSTNQKGNTLHGGPDGFDKRRWHIVLQSENSVCFTLISSDADQGFPGNLQVQVCYQLSETNELTIKYKASTDKACPINLTNHAYFNLMGAESAQDCLQHQLMIAADQYLPVNEAGIPIGHFNTVQETSFDFRELKTIGRDFQCCAEQKTAAGYDHSFLLNKAHQDGKKVAVRCISPDKKVTLEVTTTKPAVQLYSGNYLMGTPNRMGGEYLNHCAFALETQFLPDSPNHPEWDQPCCIFKAGERYVYQTSYQFIINDKQLT